MYRKPTWRPALLVPVLFACIGNVAAQPDVAGCKDPGLASRMSGFYLHACPEGWNEVQMLAGADKEQAVEGQATVYEYHLQDGAKAPSRLQVLRNYENALLSKGAEKIYFEARDGGEGPVGATFRVRNGGDTYWLAFGPFVGDQSRMAGYTLTLVRVEGMKQDVQAADMLRELDAGKSLALYINFDTAKATIRPDSLGIVEEIHQLLKANPALKIAIEGHTDNAGSKAGNQALSAQRAAIVKQAVVARGISADRIQTRGLGQAKPLADNGSEEGRAKNRRVEIRKF